LISSTVGVTSSLKSEQGHTPGGFGGLAVVKDQVAPDEIGLPSVSVPDKVAVWRTKDARFPVGVNVMVLVVLS